MNDNLKRSWNDDSAGEYFWDEQFYKMFVMRLGLKNIYQI